LEKEHLTISAHNVKNARVAKKDDMASFKMCHYQQWQLLEQKGMWFVP
jgi:hypothetical protein